MEDLLLKEMWTSYDKKLERSLALNHRVLTELQQQKARSVLRPLKANKIVAVILGIIWAVFLLVNIAVFVWEMSVYRLFFVVSAMAIVITTIAAVVVYIRQVILIQQLDNSMNIVEAQKKLAILQTTSINIARVLFLSMPFYSTFYINKTMVENGTIGLWVFQATVTIALTALAIWLYRNMKMENADKRWFKFIFGNSEWSSVTKAMSFLREIEDFQKE